VLILGNFYHFVFWTIAKLIDNYIVKESCSTILVFSVVAIKCYIIDTLLLAGTYIAARMLAALD